jgi:hypothetical protein
MPSPYGTLDLKDIDWEAKLNLKKKSKKLTFDPKTLGARVKAISKSTKKKTK